MMEHVESLTASVEEIQALLASERNMHTGAFCVCSENDL